MAVDNVEPVKLGARGSSSQKFGSSHCPIEARLSCANEARRLHPPALQLSLLMMPKKKCSTETPMNSKGKDAAQVKNKLWLQDRLERPCYLEDLKAATAGAWTMQIQASPEEEAPPKFLVFEVWMPFFREGTRSWGGKSLTAAALDRPPALTGSVGRGRLRGCSRKKRAAVTAPLQGWSRL